MLFVKLPCIPSLNKVLNLVSLYLVSNIPKKMGKCFFLANVFGCILKWHFPRTNALFMLMEWSIGPIPMVILSFDE